MDKTNLTGLSREELVAYFESLGEKSFRAYQLFSWIHHHRVTSFDEMTNIPKTLRQKLKNNATLEQMITLSVNSSRQTQSRKFLFELSDGKTIESVYLPDDHRHTVCLSVQVGCGLNCKFCATGKMGFIRHLSTSEIVGQLITIQREVLFRITNVVLMGMGEPFLNYENVIKAAYLINDDYGFSISARKITISTAGIIPKIYQYADEGHKFNLAFSLNAADDTTRLNLMPINRKYPLEQCFRALEYYTQKSKRRVTLEYVLIAGVNDSNEDVRRLVKITNQLKCKLNVISYNPIHVEDFKSPINKELNVFVQKVSVSRRVVMVRWSQGKDINGACGQLYAESNS